MGQRGRGVSIKARWALTNWVERENIKEYKKKNRIKFAYWLLMLF